MYRDDLPVWRDIVVLALGVALWLACVAYNVAAYHRVQEAYGHKYHTVTASECSICMFSEK